MLTPLARHFKLTAAQKPETYEERVYMNKVPCASAVGSVMHAMICTRTDLAYAVSMGQIHGQSWNESLGIPQVVMRYLKGSVNYGLVYGGSNETDEAIRGYVDSDFSRCIDTRKFITG